MPFLAERSLRGIAEYILSDACKSVVLLTGAGVSVASGVPDFRSAGGLYDTMRTDLITANAKQKRAMKRDPQEALTRTLFMQTALPYLEVRRPFILESQKLKPTLSHRFAELLHVKTGKLTRVFTQNIDGLDFKCERLPAEKVVPCHGTIARAGCEACGAIASDYARFVRCIRENIKDIYGTDPDAPPTSSPVGLECEKCGKQKLKPTSVLYGAQLPAEFDERSEQDAPGVDLLIVAGTSLKVFPAAGLVERVSPSAARVVVNREPVGLDEGLGLDYDGPRDFLARGDCDDVFLQLIDLLGWGDELDADTLPEASRKRVVEARVQARRKEAGGGGGGSDGPATSGAGRAAEKRAADESPAGGEPSAAKAARSD